MSFEKQFCEKCKKLAYCVNTQSIGETRLKQKWLCENCFAWLGKSYAQRKDTIRSIMIQCGIEDLESN